MDGCDWGNMRPEFSLADCPPEESGRGHTRANGKSGGNTHKNTHAGAGEKTKKDGRHTRADGERKPRKKSSQGAHIKQSNRRYARDKKRGAGGKKHGRGPKRQG